MTEQVEPLLSIRNLAVEFRQGAQSFTAVDDLSFDLFSGETLALVGESGSGKSVTALSVMKLLPYPTASHPSGDILFTGDSLLRKSNQQMQTVRGNEIGMIFQEPMTALNPLHTIEKQIGEVICLHRKMDRRSARPLVIDLLRQVKIPDPESRLGSYPHELSGGQRQRIMIAMALANEPRLLIADEPTTALDVTVQNDILDLLSELKSSKGLSILFITHDLGVVRRFADRMVVMKDGKAIEQGYVADIFSRPEHHYTQDLINATPDQVPVPLPNDRRSNLLSTTDLNVSFVVSKTLFGRTRTSFQAVKQASIQLSEGETLGIVGESGSGKSTLAMAILRLTPSQGEIQLNGQRLDGLNQRQIRPLRKDLQIVFQDPFASLSPRLTIARVISEGLAVHSDCSEQESDQRVVSAMKEVDLNPDWRHRYPHELSGGQRQRVAIARALILNPKVLILDEPTSALDRSVQRKVIDLLHRLQQERGLSYLFISHDLQVVRALSHRVVVMRSGEIVESGSREDIFQRPRSDYTRALIEASYINQS